MAEAKRHIRAGFFACLPGLLLLPVGWLIAIATGLVLTGAMVPLATSFSIGSIMLGQGLFMRVTKLRIDLTLKTEMTTLEKVLTGFYALLWVVAVVGTSAVLVANFLH